ncbi:MAG: N-acetyltransferase [Chitinophagaceae bacterium]|nr:MAG: N-acetyltransferase [Chitinophagaceae bacterium]
MRQAHVPASGAGQYDRGRLAVFSCPSHPASPRATKRTNTGYRITTVMQFEYLETERLRLRLLTQDIYRHVFLHFSVPEQKAFFGQENEAELAMERLRGLGGMETYRSTIRYFHLLDKETGRTLGSCGYHNWYPGHRRAEIGYALTATSLRGNGLMREALARVLEYGFAEMNLNRVEALIGAGNEPSLRLVRRFGFSQEGVLRQHWNVDGVLHDSLVFSLLESEYTQAHNSRAQHPAPSEAEQ